jgi:hypothetical protein
MYLPNNFLWFFGPERDTLCHIFHLTGFPGDFLKEIGVFYPTALISFSSFGIKIEFGLRLLETGKGTS